MSSIRGATDARTVHMQVTYFTQGSEVDGSPSAQPRISLEDVRRAFRQIELLIEYARSMSAGPSASAVSSVDPGIQEALADLAATELATELAQEELVAAYVAEDLKATRLNLEAVRARLQGKRPSQVERGDKSDTPTEPSRVTRAGRTQCCAGGGREGATASRANLGRRGGGNGLRIRRRSTVDRDGLASNLDCRSGNSVEAQRAGKL
jgi:hypothetical protein